MDRQTGALSPLLYDEATHRYFFDGRELPSVTRILAPLVDWRGVDPAVLERKRQIGMAVHGAIDLDLQGDLDLDSLAAEVQPYFAAWRKFELDTEFECERCEQKVYSATYRYAGRLDLIGRLGGSEHPALVDVKTTVGLHPATALQTAAYLHAANECTADPAARLRQRYALQLREDGSYRLVPYRDREDWLDFLAMLRVYRLREKLNLK